MKTLLLFTLILLPQLSQAGLDLLSPKEIRTLIGNFPALGSAEERRDDDILLEFQHRRTEEDCKAAQLQSNLKVEKVFVVPMGPLTEKEYHKYSFQVLKLTAKVAINVLRAKGMYDRPRPYVRNPDIKPCISLEGSTSYPSGHSATGRAAAVYLAAKFPDRADAIMKAGDNVGNNRMLGGVHHPSDVVAGRIIGNIIAKKNLPTAEGGSDDELR